jgi:cell shape-determining protein MreC
VIWSSATTSWNGTSGEWWQPWRTRLTPRSVAVSSLLDLESKYNRAIEEKTLLEQEVVQRQELEEENQRLKDDLRGELNGRS